MNTRRQTPKSLLEKENALLKRKLRHAMEQQMVHESINDNLFSLLTRVNDDYQRSISLIEKKKRDLETLTEQLSQSYDTEILTNVKLRNQILERELAESALRESETHLRHSLEEKDVLLREIHHRVKNNLQVVSSLLQMSLKRSTDENVREALSESCSRVNTMALIHSQLYQTGDFSGIDMRLHTQQLFQNLSALYGHQDQVQWKIEVQEVPLSVDQAIPLALVMNELISNAFKHAFKGQACGWIHVSMCQLPNNSVSVEVRDNGNGLSPGIDVWKVETLGLRLVRNIVDHQLRGKLCFENLEKEFGSGLRVRIMFQKKQQTECD